MKERVAHACPRLNDALALKRALVKYVNQHPAAVTTFLSYTTLLGNLQDEVTFPGRSLSIVSSISLT